MFISEEAGDEADDYEFPGEAKPEEDAGENEAEEWFFIPKNH